MDDTVNRYKLWSTEVRQNPHPTYTQIRKEGAIYKAIGPVSGNTLHFFVAYNDAVSMLKDPRFGKDYRKLLSDDELSMMANDPTAILNEQMLQRDPPEHTRLRSLVQKVFTPRMVASMEDRITAISNELIAEMKQMDSSVDFLEAFAFPLPITLIAEMLGVSAEKRDNFRKWVRVVLYEANEQTRAINMMEFVRFCNETIEERRQEPSEDLISALVTAQDEGDTLSHQEVLSMIFLLLAAGYETTVNLLGNGLYALLNHPEQMASLKADVSLMPNAVEEMLRYESPLENTLSRWAFEDVDWNGHMIQQGELVYATLLSANRDEAIFDAPHTFDITRENANKHIAFGQGIHYCLGAPLARLEGQIAFPLLLEAFPNIKLAADTITWNEQVIFHGLTKLPISLS